jgi:hypothetical protein
MRNVRVPVMLIVGLSMLWVVGRPTELAADRGGEKKIALIDDCDPDDPNWAPVGCLQEKGDVTNAEFGLFLRSPFYNNAPAGSPPSLFLVGHPSWRNEPSHLVVEEGKRIDVKNEGGRPHTFTKVAEFGGGRVPPLLVGTQTAPECVLPAGEIDPNQLAPGARLKLKTSGEGIVRFQCCFHPWMRSTIRVVPDDHHKR